MTAVAVAAAENSRIGVLLSIFDALKQKTMINNHTFLMGASEGGCQTMASVATMAHCMHQIGAWTVSYCIVPVYILWKSMLLCR